MNNAEIVQRLDRLKSNRSNIEGIWDEVDRYVMPLHEGSPSVQIAGEGSKVWATKEVWDSTAPIGAERLASTLHTSLVGPYRWFGIGWRNGAFNKEPRAKQFLDECSDIMYDALTASNFGLEMASNFLSMVGYGNGCLTQALVSEENWEGFDFTATPVREMFFEENWRGHVLRYYRPMMWTAGQIVSKFGDKAPQHIKELDEKGVREPMEVIFCIWPRKGAKPMSISEKARSPELRPFGYKYVLRQGLLTLGDEGGYYEMPAYVMRYHRAAGSQWGFGPGMMALPTVKLLNALQEAIVNAAEKAVDPASLVTERGLLSDLDLGKGGLTTVRSVDDIVPFESKARFDVSESLISDHRMMVRKFFREDDITLKESPQMTATESTMRFEQMNRLFGPTVARIQNDGLDPVLQTTFNMMYRMGQLPEVPDVVLQRAPEMQIEYRGPMMRAQRTDEVAALERLAASVAALAKMEFTRAKLVLNDEQLVREIAERLSAPASVLRTTQEVEQQAQRQEQMQQMMAQAEIAKTSAEGDRAAADAQGMMGGNRAA